MKRSALFLIELVLMILIFSVCAAICVSLLGKAWSISQSSDHLTRAVYLAESAATHLQTGVAYEADAEEGYQVYITPSEEADGLYAYSICVYYEEEEIYSLTVTSQEGPK